MKEKRGCCPALWFSGFFGLGLVVHTVRLIFQVPVTIGTFAVPLSLSVLAMIIFGALSGGLFYLGCKKFSCGGLEAKRG